MSLVPLVTGIGSILFFKSKLNKYKALALILGVVGVIIVNISEYNLNNFNFSDSFFIGTILVFIAVISEAIFTLGGKKLSKELDPILITGLATWISALLFLPMTVFQLENFKIEEIGTNDIVALLWWGVGTLALGTIIWYNGVKRAQALSASMFMTLMPISALLSSYVILDESFQPSHLLGIMLVVISILLFNVKKLKN
jgi:drug/metabolite transporter (DMT)-like permease